MYKRQGLIQSPLGDITLTGHDVRQLGVAVSSTSVTTRGTVHLLNSASDTSGTILLGKDSTTTILLQDLSLIHILAAWLLAGPAPFPLALTRVDLQRQDQAEAGDPAVAPGEGLAGVVLLSPISRNER